MDPFLAGEAELVVLHRTIRINVEPLLWQQFRISSNDRYPTVRTKRGGQVQPELVKRIKFWRARAHAAAMNVPGVERGRVVVYYRFPTNHRREVSNLQPTSKAILDGLVDAGVFPDDNDKHVMGPDNRREPVNGPQQVIVRVYVAAGNVG
ncbi:hypothetical protein ACMX2H_16075 [Arthrobacter sulfonylureivorans]|uniref:hypothetical protein n=1 Tax=Arthrobacter sulfonylureivorans TaxID=2486855 RepID=UPI0039E609C6